MFTLRYIDNFTNNRISSLFMEGMISFSLLTNSAYDLQHNSFLFLATFGLNLVVVAVLRDSRVIGCCPAWQRIIVAVLSDRLL